MIWCTPPWFSVASQTKNKRKPFGIKRTLMLIMIMVVRAQGDWFGLWFGLRNDISAATHWIDPQKSIFVRSLCNNDPRRAPSIPLSFCHFKAASIPTLCRGKGWLTQQPEPLEWPDNAHQLAVYKGQRYLALAYKKVRIEILNKAVCGRTGPKVLLSMLWKGSSPEEK